MTLAWTAVSWARGSSTRWGSWGWSWHQRDQAAGASPPPLLGFRPPHGPRPHPGRRRAQERQQQARGGRKVHGEGRGPLLAPARGGGHGRGGGGGLYRKRSPFSDAANLYFRSSTSCTSVADFLVSYRPTSPPPAARGRCTGDTTSPHPSGTSTLSSPPWLPAQGTYTAGHIFLLLGK